jgi:hypothetical protein
VLEQVASVVTKLGLVLVKVATPEALGIAVPIGVLPLRNVTVPTGEPVGDYQHGLRKAPHL